jgi:hypothetical protein
LFVMTAATQKNIATKFISWSIWRYIAVLSYSIYLVHLSCIGFLNIFSFYIKNYFVGYPNLRAFITLFVAFTLSALCALIVFTLIERPFLLMRSYILKERALSYSSQLKLLVTQKTAINDNFSEDGLQAETANPCAKIRFKTSPTRMPFRAMSSTGSQFLGLVVRNNDLVKVSFSGIYRCASFPGRRVFFSRYYLLKAPPPASYPAGPFPPEPARLFLSAGFF